MRDSNITLVFLIVNAFRTSVQARGRFFSRELAYGTSVFEEKCVTHASGGYEHFLECSEVVVGNAVTRPTLAHRTESTLTQ